MTIIILTREHGILHITFSAETNAADTHTHTQRDSDAKHHNVHLRSLSGGEGNNNINNNI